VLFDEMHNIDNGDGTKWKRIKVSSLLLATLRSYWAFGEDVGECGVVAGDDLCRHSGYARV
jgi:hypothetical protein